MQQESPILMHYILYKHKDLKLLQDEVLPLLKGDSYELIPFPFPKEFKLAENSKFISYLNDDALREFIPIAFRYHLQLGILPHPENPIAITGLGLSSDISKTIDQIYNDEITALDVLLCNDEPVFQSVNFGDVFILSEDDSKKNFFYQVAGFIKNIRRSTRLTHRNFTFLMDGEKLINTSALGVIVVEHPQASVISKQLIPESSIDDGMFNVLILSPENLSVLFWFFLRSLIPFRKPIRKLPNFIGYIKTDNLEIENQETLQCTIDGENMDADRIKLNVKKQALQVLQETNISAESTENNGKKSLKIENLPTGNKKDLLVKRTLPWLPRATTEEFEELFKVLRENATLKTSFLVMMILSTLIATFGLYGDSSPVIIGAMILAPIISPIVSFSMGMVRYDTNMLKTAIITILTGTIVSLLFSAGVSRIIPLRLLTSEIDARLSPTLLDMGIAVASGIAAAYAHAKEGIAKSLAGVAIAVALVPPLAVAGIGIGWWDWEIFSGAFLLYLTNLAGIIMFAGITFLILGFAPFRRAKMGLLYTLFIIIGVMIPLSLSFDRILEEAKITKELEGANFNEIVLKDVKVRFGKPVTVSLKIVGPELIEAEEIKNIKNQIEEKIGKKVILEVVSAVEF